MDKSVRNNQKVSENYTHDRLQQEVFQYIYNKYPETRGSCWHTPNEFIPDTFFIERQVKHVLKGIVPAWLQNIFSLQKKHLVSSLSKRKSIGVLSGVTDLVLYHVGVLLMMDVKLTGDTLSEAQLRFIKANELQGGIFIEINTLEQAKIDIDNFMHTPILNR